MKSTVVDESLSSFKPMYCYREYQASTRLIQQYEKSTLKFIEELKILQSSIHSKLTVNDKVDEYKKLVTNVMDQLALLKRKKLQIDMKQPWYNEQIAKEIWVRRLKERERKSSNTE